MTVWDGLIGQSDAVAVLGSAATAARARSLPAARPRSVR